MSTLTEPGPRAASPTISRTEAAAATDASATAATGHAEKPQAEATAEPRRWLSRRTVRRISVVRDVLASVKDAGIIAIVVALLMFHDEVGGFLVDLDLLRAGDDRVVDVSRSLARLNRALDAAVPASAAGASGAIVATASLGKKVLRAERRLLRSEDAAFIDDWIVVIATLPDAAQAEAVVTQLAALSVPASLVQKAGRWRVVATAGSAESAQSVLNRVRPRYPRALPTTMSSWCPPLPPGAVANGGCRRT